MTSVTNRLLSLFVGSLLFLCSCKSKERPPKVEFQSTAANIEYTASEKVDINFATGFDIHYYEGYKRLDVLNPYQDQTDTLHYVLVQRGTALPEFDTEAQVIEIPIQSMIATSTTHLALTDMLDANAVVKGVTQPDYVYNQQIRKGLEAGRIEGFSGGEFNKEQALALNPDLIMISGGQASQLDNFRVLLDSGINVLVNSEWLEQTPLGKAEWIKMMGALLNKEALANRRFREVKNRYQELERKIEGIAEKPLVINNIPYKGAWFVSGGNSFVAQYLKDAGADYPWFENASAGGLRMDFEAVYEVGLRADIWLNPGNAKSKEDILATDSRFKDFKAFETGRIYNNNRRMSASGGNDFWESGVVHPEIVLADLIKIMHPSLLPEHQLYYYQKVE